MYFRIEVQSSFLTFGMKKDSLVKNIALAKTYSQEL